MWFCGQDQFQATGPSALLPPFSAPTAKLQFILSEHAQTGTQKILSVTLTSRQKFLRTTWRHFCLDTVGHAPLRNLVTLILQLRQKKESSGKQ